MFLFWAQQRVTSRTNVNVEFLLTQPWQNPIGAGEWRYHLRAWLSAENLPSNLRPGLPSLLIEVRRPRHSGFRTGEQKGVQVKSHSWLYSFIESVLIRTEIWSLEVFLHAVDFSHNVSFDTNAQKFVPIS